MKRKIDKALSAWQQSPSHKVVLLRGARQVGKTYAVRKLGTSFTHFLEINFEEEKELCSLFAGSLNPRNICEKLSAIYATPITPGETLLFFDEIQACPQALSSLRFFYEKMPDLHVIAAGSLLEFALAEIPSQGVGRIHSLYMHPMSFVEFLIANGAEAIIKFMDQSSPAKPLDAIFHQKLIEFLKVYFIIGGMPEVVQTYLDHGDLVLCQQKLDDLLITFKDDFAKYKKKSPVGRLREVFDSIVFQAGRKLKYSNIDSSSSTRALKEALDLLLHAGLAHKIYHTSAQGLPLGAQINTKKFKVILFDVGIQQRLLGLDLRSHVLAHDFQGINRGNIAEIFVGLELIATGEPTQNKQLYYWHREERGSNAEVDYVIQRDECIIPIEVKAGTKGQMQSMHRFLNTHPAPYGVRVSLENFCEYENIRVIPLYAAYKLNQM